MLVNKLNLDESNIVELLSATGPLQELLFAAARAARKQAYGDRVVLRGVTEITNVCRVNCDYCPMRRDNTRNNHTFLLDPSAIFQVAEAIAENGINIVFFQGGEIPQTTRLVGSLIPRIRRLFDDRVEILLNLGLKRRDEYAYLRDQGATSYILKHETSDPKLNERLRHESYKRRIQGLQDLLDLGFRVGTGMITGLPGQSPQSLARDILLARDLGVHMCSASPFVPAPNTPLEQEPAGAVDTALNALAIMRLVSPSWLIPAVSALEKNQEGGQLAGFHAGANVMTVNFTPETQRGRYLIYGKDRFVVRSEHARQTIRAAGLRPARSVFAQPPVKVPVPA